MGVESVTRVRSRWSDRAGGCRARGRVCPIFESAEARAAPWSVGEARRIDGESPARGSLRHYLRGRLARRRGDHRAGRVGDPVARRSALAFTPAPHGGRSRVRRLRGVDSDTRRAELSGRVHEKVPVFDGCPDHRRPRRNAITISEALEVFLDAGLADAKRHRDLLADFTRGPPLPDLSLPGCGAWTTHGQQPRS